MGMKQWKRGAFLLLAAGVVAMAVTGCKSSDGPKEALAKALAKTRTAQSYTYTGTFIIDDISLPQETTNGADLGNAAVMQALPILLKGAEFKVRGAMRRDPQQTELIVDATLGTGDVKLSATVPFLMTADHMYMKVPQIPGVAIPDTIAGKFISIDAKKLAEEQGLTIPDSGGSDSDSKQLAQDASQAITDSLDEKTYFDEPKASDLKDLPVGYKADRYVRFSIDAQHADQAMTAIAEQAIPKIIDLLLQNEAYMKSLHLTKEQLEASKKELTADKLKQEFAIEALELTGGIQDGYITYEAGTIRMNSTSASKGFQLGVHFSLKQDGFNKAVKFENELPKDAVPVDQIMPIDKKAP